MKIKRLFARMMVTNLIAACFCGTTLLMCGMVNSEDTRILEDKQEAIYEKFMESDEFSLSFKQEFNKLSNAYENGDISYEEFEKNVKYLNSVENAKKVLENSNHELKSDAEKINSELKALEEKQNSSIFAKTSLIGTATFGGIGIASTVTYAAMDIFGKEDECNYRV